MFGDDAVDLTTRFPEIAPVTERAIRLAKDPIAASDFFDFSIRCLFEHLLGWDLYKCTSKPRGGILGYLKAYYGTAECTERGSLHGHFVIWLDGGLNPTDIHQKMMQDVDFQKRFLDFFEYAIQYHLPDIEIEIDNNYEPRTQRPPCPTQIVNDAEKPLEWIQDWNEIFVSEVKACGEILQRHECRPVCHKYGNTNKCCFLFPHEIVDASYFDPTTNSIVLMCRDANINYFNPYILVFCRHNHDIKCILSGKSAKSAMFYITDYITKMDVKTYHQMLSLMSKVVAQMPSCIEKLSVRDKAKTLLHKCLSQFTKQQQIHAQQAVRYIQGYGDGLSSHVTVPLLSSILLSYIKRIYKTNNVNDISNESEDTEDNEPTYVRIQLNNNGDLVDCNQVHDYLYRSNELQHLNFYDFARCIRCEKKSDKSDHNNTRWLLKCHKLQPPHALHSTHRLVQHTDENVINPSKVLIPRIIGCAIPRSTSYNEYCIFMLSHFKPWSISKPIISNDSNFVNTFESYSFSQRAMDIMKNWDAIHECEDACDAEHLRKRGTATRESQTLTQSLKGIFPDDDDDDDDSISININTSNMAKKEFDAMQFVLKLKQSEWFSKPSNMYLSQSIQSLLPDPSPRLLKEWKVHITNQERLIIAK